MGGWKDGVMWGCFKGSKWRESHRGRGGGALAVISCYATTFLWLRLLKMEEKNSFAISAACPEGPGLPQSHGSVPMFLLLSR